MKSDHILTTNSVSRTFFLRRSFFNKHNKVVYAVNQVSLGIKKGQTLGIVGESGCGKSTLAKMIVMLDQPTGGGIFFNGTDLREYRKNRRSFWQKVQFVFQDPLSSLNPRKTVRQILETPLRHLTGQSARQRSARVEELMEMVNLRPEFLERHPHEFSGGQSQRIGVARSIAANPELIVLDEPVSALDVSVQAQVLNLLRELKEKMGLTYLFISHDLAVVENVSDVVAVMYLGKIVELGTRQALFSSPLHPYTHILLSSVPVPGKKSQPELLQGEPPSPLSLPPGCPFEPRCPNSRDMCRHAAPLLKPLSNGHQVACYFPDVSIENAEA